MSKSQKLLVDNAGFRNYEVEFEHGLQYLGIGNVIRLEGNYTMDSLYVKEGTSLSLYGVFGRPPDFQVIIDGGQPTDGQYGKLDATVNATYTSPPMQEGVKHIVNIIAASPAWVDYATVGLGDWTYTGAMDLIVDEGDSSIVYTGQWSKNESKIVSTAKDTKSPLTRMPYGGSTMQTNQAESSATFEFDGQTVSVVGAPPTGFINVEFTLDGNSTSKAYSIDPEAYLHYEYFNAWSLTPGNHTLQVKYVSGPGNLRLDYIVYRAAFDALAIKGVNHAQTPASYTYYSGAPTHTSTPGDDSISRATHIIARGAIVGAVIGAISVIVLIIAILWRRRRRQFRRLENLKQTIPPQAAQRVTQQERDETAGLGPANVATANTEADGGRAEHLRSLIAIYQQELAGTDGARRN
ncbi:hypothetical protein DXG01_010503 [Tephrocybe rancida]|nr:hypothetical protein DXG01_010503 [Tephrocybe rancida]